MKKRILSLTLVMLLMILSVAVMPVSATESKAEQYLASMSTEDKISMMIMPAFRWKTDEEGNKTNVTEITDDIADSLNRHSFAGVILFAQNTATNEGTTRLVDALQEENAAGGNRPQLLISIDQEGGNVTRLGQGTMTPGNMALGAINDTDTTKEVATMIGGELNAIGVNVDFAPDVDINSNPANPVIGVRSFSDDPQIVAAHGNAFVQALNDTGVISTLKHFPGHGDTDTDSHTGLPCINKSYEELKQNELIPFQTCIDAGSQMIMTAHIVYPQIETGTYVSKLTGKTINLPATLSKTIITDILRGDMGYDGVVTTDAMDMDAIAKHFDKYDAAKLAINAGVDILLMPFAPESHDDFAEFDTYITTLAQMADNGEIPIEKIDAAVLRILKLKENNGLFNAYDGSDIEERVQNAVDTVGTMDSHDKEWEITKKAITLVKNDDNTLPLTKEGQKTIVLVPYDDETIPMNYAVRKLNADGKLPKGADVIAYSYYKKTIDDVLPMIDGADNVIFMSEIYGASALKGATAQMADTLADTVHENGGKFIVMSVSLPYDVARFEKADAIMIAYLARSMPVDPGNKVREMQQYGPNMPVALYMMFSASDAPTAKLPINIPKLDDEYNYTDTMLYERGFGLTYQAEPVPDTPILGDVDSDREVTIVDATYIQRKLASIPIPFELNNTVADVDKDGEVTIIDATFIQRWLANLPAPDGIGEPIGAEPAQPSDTEHKLLSCVDTYQWDYEYNDWELSRTTTIEYEKGYPILFDSLDNYEDAEHIQTNITYTFDGDLPLTRTEIKESEESKKTVEYSDGRVYNVKQETVGSGSYEKQMYQYGHGDEYFTMVLHDQLRAGNEYNPDTHMEEVDSVSVTTENGLLKSTTNTGVYAYWSEREEKKWIRFRGVYTNTYDTDGIVTLSTADLSGFGIQQQAKYEVVKDNGRITEIIQYTHDGEGEWSPFTKYVFEYNDTEISAARYSLMMNDFIANHGGNYYIFNWY